MNKNQAVVIFLGFIILVIIGSMFSISSEQITPEELRYRVESTTTDWANYHEDLKRYIGSTPVARWKGKPTKSWIEGDTISIVFEISGYSTDQSYRAASRCVESSGVQVSAWPGDTV